MVSKNRCPICTDADLDEPTYAYLFGLYLGDGCLSRQGRTSWKLRIVQDMRYPLLISRCREAMATVLEVDRVREVSRGGYIEIHSSWQHWVCLFPQHGPGRKHLRSLTTTSWQRQALAGNERPLIAGLIHSDGSRHMNRVKRPVRGGMKTYAYPRYQFNNRSKDLTHIFTSALDSIGVHWTRGGRNSISIARRLDVLMLDEFVERKA